MSAPPPRHCYQSNPFTWSIHESLVAQRCKQSARTKGHLHRLGSGSKLGVALFPTITPREFHGEQVHETLVGTSTLSVFFFFKPLHSTRPSARFHPQPIYLFIFNSCSVSFRATSSLNSRVCHFSLLSAKAADWSPSSMLIVCEPGVLQNAKTSENLSKDPFY